ncbi:MAG TPA: nicotinate-nicotinamide nucleotide adenylyltransferase [Streptosporangiaceae bacterium]
MFTLFYGLSADPVHQGHIDLVTAAVTELDGRGYEVSLVLLVPVYRRNPVGEQPKYGLPETYEDRVQLTELAAGVMSKHLAGTGILNCTVTVSRAARELAMRSGGPNYDLETLRYLRDRLEPGDELLFLMSAELVSGPQPEFGRWHEPVEIARLATVAIAPRPGYPPNTNFLDGLTAAGGRFLYLNSVVTMDISSSQIRERLTAGADPHVLAGEGLIPAPEADYIARHPGLYRPRTADA